MIEKIRKIIKDRKIAKLRKVDNIPIVIPSLEKFLDAFKDNIRKESALSSKPVSHYNINKLVEEFQDISVAALIDTLINVGYKRKKK